MKKIILGLIGEVASGKTTATNHLKEKYSSVSFRFSDMLRDILKRIYVEQDRSHMQTLSTILRQNFGEDIMSKVISKDVENSDCSFIIVEGIRRPSDVTYLKELVGFKLVAINTSTRNRFNRLTHRSENPDDKTKTWEQFQIDGQQESEEKIQEVAKDADYIIDNNGTLDNLYAQINRIIEQIKKE